MTDKVQYWLDICVEDIKAVNSLIKGGNHLYAGFFCHLIAEKALKAVIANITDDVPPKIHNLIRLAERGNIYNDLSNEQRGLLENLGSLHIEARYPEYKIRVAKKLTKEKIKNIYKETEEFLCWIKNKLEK